MDVRLLDDPGTATASLLLGSVVSTLRNATDEQQLAIGREMAAALARERVEQWRRRNHRRRLRKRRRSARRVR